MAETLVLFHHESARLGNAPTVIPTLEAFAPFTCSYQHTMDLDVGPKEFVSPSLGDGQVPS
jgi:hypothetical protein